MDEVSRRIVEQRVRNRVMETLELAGSFEAQQAYAETVPIANVPAEVINQWSDQVHIDPSMDPDISAVYSSQEVDAMRRFHRVWLQACDAYPDGFPSVAEIQAIPEWSTLRDQARAAKAIFDQRGPMPEDREAD
jgi:hypothetical protein